MFNKNLPQSQLLAPLERLSRAECHVGQKTTEHPAPPLERERRVERITVETGEWNCQGEEIVDNTETRKKFDLQARILNSRGEEGGEGSYIRDTPSSASDESPKTGKPGNRTTDLWYQR